MANTDLPYLQKEDFLHLDCSGFAQSIFYENKEYCFSSSCESHSVLVFNSAPSRNSTKRITSSAPSKAKEELAPIFTHNQIYIHPPRILWLILGKRYIKISERTYCKNPPLRVNEDFFFSKVAHCGSKSTKSPNIVLKSYMFNDWSFL